MKKQMLVFAISAVVSCLGLIAGVNLNISALILPLVYMVVFAIEVVHCGPYFTAVTATLNLVLSLVVSKDLFTTFVMVPVMILAGVLTGVTVVKNYNSKLSVLFGILATGGVYAAYIIYSIKFIGINPVDDMFVMMEFSLKEMFAEMGMNDLYFVSSYLDMCKNMYIAVMIIVFSITGFIAAYVASVSLKLFKNSSQLNLSLSVFKADMVTVFIYIGVLLCSLFTKNGMLSVVFMDLYFVLQFYLTVCGISLVYYIIKKKLKVSSFIHKLIGLVLLTMSITGFFSTILVLVAIVDGKKDFRGLQKENEI